MIAAPLLAELHAAVAHARLRSGDNHDTAIRFARLSLDFWGRRLDRALLVSALADLVVAVELYDARRR